MNEFFDLEEQTQCTFHDDANMEFWEIYIYNNKDHKRKLLQLVTQVNV